MKNYSQVEAARNLGVKPKILGRWIKGADNDDRHAFRAYSKLTPEQEEIRNLKAQVKRLKVERKILKKQRFSLPEKRSKVFVYCAT